MSPDKKEDHTFVYRPKDTKLNWTEDEMDGAKTEYERRRKSFDRDSVKDLTKGNYGRKDG